jgi:hypothetical protein
MFKSIRFAAVKTERPSWGVGTRRKPNSDSGF